MTNKLVRKRQISHLWLFFCETLAYFLHCCGNCHWLPISFPFSILLLCRSLYLWSNKRNLGGFLCIPNIIRASKWLHLTSGLPANQCLEIIKVLILFFFKYFWYEENIFEKKVTFFLFALLFGLFGAPRKLELAG